MPRAKKRTGSPEWSAPTPPLSNKARDQYQRHLKSPSTSAQDRAEALKEIAKWDRYRPELLGYLFDDPSSVAEKVKEDALRDIEKWLAFYPGAVEATKNAPMPEGMVKRGRQANEPRLKVIGELLRVLWRCRGREGRGTTATVSDTEKYERPQQGGVTLLSEAQDTEATFVRRALQIGKIPYRKDGDVRRYFDQPGAALPSAVRYRVGPSGEVLAVGVMLKLEQAKRDRKRGK